MRKTAGVFLWAGFILGLFLPGRLAASVKYDASTPQVAFAAQEITHALKEDMHCPAGTDVVVEVEATDKDGIKESKLYLNGLLLKADESKPNTWSAKSDELLKALKPGRVHLKAESENDTGTRGWQEIKKKLFG